MKTLPLLFLFYLFQTIISEDVSVKGNYEKLQKIPILNGKKHVKKPIYTKVPFKRPNFMKKYTVFQSLQGVKPEQKSLFGNGPFNEDLISPINVPDSLIFSVNSMNVQKTRVKKPLVFQESLLRLKRSAEPSKNETEVTKNDDKAVIKVEELEKKVVQDVEQGTTNLSNPKRVKKSVIDEINRQKQIKLPADRSKGGKRKIENNTIQSKKPKGKKEVKRDGKSKVSKKNKNIKRQGKSVEKASANVKKLKENKGKKLKKRAALRSKKHKKGKKSKRKGKKKPGRKGKKSKKQEKSNKKDQNVTNLRQVDTRRLIASNAAAQAAYPYTVSIQKNGEHWCTGAILNDRIVITTANCLWKSEIYSHMKVRACSRYSDSDGQLLNIELVMKHPGFDIRSPPGNDIALIRTDKKIRFSESCHYVDLPNVGMTPPDGRLWVSSWGAERRDGIFESGHRPLQGHHVKLIDHDTCNSITLRFGVSVPPDFLCASQDGRRAPCTRDTGAPAVVDGILWGLASWGLRKKCATERFPAMFSNLAAESNINFLMYATTKLMSDLREPPSLDRFRVMYTPKTPEPYLFY